MLASTTYKFLASRTGGHSGALTTLVVAGIIAGLVSAGHYYLFRMGPQSDWLGMGIVKLLVWLVWIVFALATLDLAARFPIKSPIIIRRVVIHLLLMVVVVGLYLALYTLLLWSMARQPVPIALLFQRVMAEHSTYYVLAYWALLALEHVLHFAETSHTREKKARDLQVRLQRARLDVLHARLRPHFLFNALNSVSSVIMRGDREQANDIVASLAELLRKSLDASDDTLVPFEEELDLARRYLKIVSQRFRDRLSVSINVDPQTHRFPVPLFTLQNLVENAVKHGVEKTEGPVCLKIEADCRDGKLRVRVVNSIPEAQIDTTIEGSGIGLRSIRERLTAYYGDEYDMDISTADNLFTVSMSLPSVTSEGATNA